MASSVSGVDNRAADTGGAGQTKRPTDPLANEQTFLKLLVAQIKNQDPMKPADGLQYVAQLAQFSQLEQLIQIRADLGLLTEGLVPADAQADPGA